MGSPSAETSAEGHEFRSGLVRSKGDGIVLLSVFVALMALMILLRRVVAEMSWFAIGFSLFAIIGVFSACFTALWTSRARLRIFDDHVVIEWRPGDASARPLVIEYEDLRSVSRIGPRVFFRIDGQGTVTFQASRLNAEDAFDVLRDKLDDYPDCVVVAAR